MPGRFQPAEQRTQPHHSVAVQICGRFVHHDYFGSHSTNGCDSDKLLFSAGQREYSPVEQPVNVHLCAYCLYPFPHDSARQWNILHAQRNLVGRISSENWLRGSWNTLPTIAPN